MLLESSSTNHLVCSLISSRHKDKSVKTYSSELKDRNILLNSNADILSMEAPMNNVWDFKVASSDVFTEDARMKEISKMILSTLSKLSPERFDHLSELILKLGVMKEQILAGIVDLLFEKALQETREFGPMYARLCQILSERSPRITAWIPSDQQNQRNIFQRILADKCNRELEMESNWAVKEAEARKQAKAGLLRSTTAERAVFLENADKILANKRRSIGFIRFVGDLYRAGLLAESIVHQCITNMLQNITCPDSEEIESLCSPNSLDSDPVLYLY